MPILVRQLDLTAPRERAALNDLRWRLLREPLGLPRGTETLAQDEDATTIHLGAFTQEGQLIGCASLIANEGIQLRAMAVDGSVQGQGVGAAILQEAGRIADTRQESLWCQARTYAVGFYERSGWHIEGDLFDVPKIGPHYVMRRPALP